MPFGVRADDAKVGRQLARIELLEMEYGKLPLAAASLSALVQQERGRRRNASSAIAITGKDVVERILAYVQKDDNLEDNDEVSTIKA